MMNGLSTKSCTAVKENESKPMIRSIYPVLELSDLKPCGDKRSRAMNNLYALPPEDIQYLEGNYPSQWQKIVEGNSKYGLIIEKFPIPKGYTIGTSTLMILIPTGYPGSMLDMFYFYPVLKKSNGASIDELTPESHFGQTWQRWSRHYSWKPGEDSVVTHIEYIKNQLLAEVK